MRNAICRASAMAALALATIVSLSPQAACAGQGEARRGGNSSDNTVSGVIGTNRNLEARLSTDRTQYPASRAVVIRLSIVNTSKLAQIVPLQGRPIYDITVKDSRSSQPVWTQSRRQSQPGFGTISLGGGQSNSFMELWDQKGKDGKRLPGGVYIVEVRFLGQTTLSTQVYLSDQGAGNGNSGGSRPPIHLPGHGGNHGGNPGGNGNEDGSGDTTSRLSVSSSRLRPGDTVNLTYVITNSANRPQTYQFSSGKMFDMEAVRTGRGGASVWRWSQGRMFTQMLQQFTLAAGQQKSFSAQWRLSGDLPDGNYDITAYLTPVKSGGSGLAAASARIYVQSSVGFPGRPALPGNLNIPGTSR